MTNNARRARALIINTFEHLEAPILSHLRSFIPALYPIGPIHILSKNQPAAAACSWDVNLWQQQDRDCITWLNSQPPKSVVYVSFGSIIVMSREETVELWNGLVNSKQRFLWVMRNDNLVISTSVPPELEEGTRERGCLVSWAPQEEVLAHPALACFLTHSGWNSTMESIVAGVPMICWPFMTDQLVNSRFVGEQWNIGLDMKDMAVRSVVERMVRTVMEGDGAPTERIKKLVGEMSEAARASVEEGGSSYLNLQNLIQHIRCLSSPQL